MDMWKYYGVTHRNHLLCNPMSREKHEELIGLIPLRKDQRVVEIASGKGEFLLRLVERYGVRATGIDLSPYFVKDARRKSAERTPDADIEFIEMNGADYRPETPESFDLAACIGASWIFQGHKGTLEALMGFAAPGGWIVAGEPYWLKEPDPEYLAASDQKRETYGTHFENVQLAENLGLTCTYILVSNLDDWDRYEGLQWHAAEAYSRGNPDDPDAREIMEKVKSSREEYLRWGRDTLGWAIYVFRKP
ncbi:MAG: SAM-dependent methyltransferase [Planctomycetota bacterium]|jgi:SAM-dependent methyltransferase